MSLELVQYNSQAVLVEDSFLTGLENATVTIDQGVNNVNSFGLPLSTKSFRRKPNVDISMTRFLSNNSDPFIITGNDEFVKHYGVSIWDGGKTYKIETIISSDQGETVSPSGTSIVHEKCLLKSINYNFSSEGYFTESLSFLGHYFKNGSGGSTLGGRSGQVFRRSDFSLSNTIFPPEVSSVLKVSNNRVLKSVEISMSINWTELPFYGEMFNPHKFKCMQLPIEVSANFNILDVGYSQPSQEYSLNGSNYYIDDSYYMQNNGNPNRQISISSAGFTYDLGSKNVLTNISRNGGDADNPSSYSTYTYTYANYSNNFKIKRE